MKGSIITTSALLLLLHCFVIIKLMTHLMVIQAYASNSMSMRTSTRFTRGRFLQGHYHHNNEDSNSDDVIRKMKEFKESIAVPPSTLISPAPDLAPSLETSPSSSRVFHVLSYGADPTGKTDSTEALEKVFSDASQSINNGVLMEGILNLGGVEIHLDGGVYLISRPLQFPSLHVGNVVIHGGTLQASGTFASDRYLIELSVSTYPSNHVTSSIEEKTSSSEYNFEYITFRDLMLDCNFKGGGIAIVNSLRIGIDNCYIVHFTSEGIRVESGHETLIRSSFLGQQITAGNDPNERNFNGTGISLLGNDNVVSDVVIFSADTGIIVSGQANLLTGVHCYNKATGFGGTGIYLKLPGLTQTRIVNSYLDYTGIVAEDPVQLIISNTFFLGDAYISFKSVKGIANGVNIADNIFSGSGKGTDIVQLDGSFRDVDQILIDRNSVRGMNTKATIAKVAVQGNGSSWTADFNGILLFPNLIKHVQYTLSTSGDSFPNYALRNVSDNKVVIESSVPAPTSVYVTVDQGFGS